MSIELRTFDHIEQFQAAKDCDDLYSLFGEAIRDFGFTNFLITDMPPLGSGLATSLILNGWSNVWFERYIEQNFYNHDPMAAFTRQTTQSFFWHEVAQRPMTKAAIRVMNEAAECGLSHGFSVPIVGNSGNQSCVTMGGDKLQIPPRGRDALHLLSIFAHGKAQLLRASTLTASKTIGQPEEPTERLTAREREVLHWVAQGKTDWEIGEILAISEQTAKAHVRNSCRKLNAVNRTHAVANALNCREIAP